MGVRPLLLVIAAGGLAGGPGCKHAPRTCCTPASPSPDPQAVADTLPVAAPHPLVPTVEPANPSPKDAAPATPRTLTAEVAGRLAAQNSAAARVLEREPPKPTPTGSGRHKKGSNGTAHATTTAFALDEARNRSAGDALDLFYKLAGVEAGLQQYLAAEAELAGLIDDAGQAARAGLKERADGADLDAQAAEVRAETIRLRGAEGELNAGLKTLLGLPTDPAVRLFADDPLRVSGTPVDADEAVRVGLKYRPDLGLLRALLASDDPDADAVARKVLTADNPLLAGPPIELPRGVKLAVKLIAPCSDWPDPGCPGATTGQIRALLAERERQAEAEIRADAEKANAFADQARVYAALAERLKLRVKDLEAERDAGRAVAGELAKAGGHLRKAEGAVLKAAVDHLTALAKLREHQGLLVREAYDPAFRP